MTIAPIRSSAARQRILDTAFRLFYGHGIRAVGVDRIIGESGVAKATFYRHFPAKDDLVVAYLDTVDGIWTQQLHDAAEAAALAHGSHGGWPHMRAADRGMGVRRSPARRRA